MFLRNLLQAATVVPYLFTTAAAQTACNNSPSLCSRAYNNMTHLGAHDSPFLRDRSTGFSSSGNQYYNSTVQLDAGVRLLSAQVHKKSGATGEDQWHLCHSSCTLLDMGTLADWLRNISSWMTSNPNEVVTLLLVDSDDATPAQLGDQFKAAGITKLAYSPPSTSVVPKTWPTLQSLIANGTRLMTFVASITPDPAYPYLMDEFSFVFENSFDNNAPTDYKCTPDRPSALKTTDQATASGKMFLMNHFLYAKGAFGIQSPNDTYVNVTNAQTGLGSLGTAIKTCTGVYGAPPTFVLTDFTNVGPAIASVDAANGVSQAVGRKSVSTAPLTEANTSGVSKGQGSLFAVVVAVVAAVAFSV